MPANPNVISFDVDTLEVKNGLYKVGLTYNPFDSAGYLFKGACLAFYPIPGEDFGIYYISDATDPNLANAKAVNASTVFFEALEFKEITVCVSGEVYLDRLLFLDGQNVYTTPPGKDPFILQLQKAGINVRTGYNITENDFPPCG